MKDKKNSARECNNQAKEVIRLQQKLRELEIENQSLRQKTVEMEKSAERYCLIMKDTDDLIAVTTFTLNPTYTYVSPSHRRIMGYTPEELIGRPGLDFIHPRDKKNLLPLLKYYISSKVKNLLTGKSPSDFAERIEYRVMDKAGQWHHLQSSVNVLKGKDELLFISRDITRQKLAESERLELEEKLRHSEKLETLGTLAGGVAHDLNNILSAIVNYPELLLLDLPPESPYRHSVIAIQKAGERAAAIVTDLLTLARKGLVIENVLCLNDMITQFLNSPECKKIKMYHPGVRIETHLDTRLSNMLGSPVHLGKLLMNLVSNAVEAIREEGDVTVSTGNRSVEKPVSGYDYDIPKGEYVVLEVADNGSGISNEDIKKIFLPFYTKKQLGRSGTGLGMTVVWGIVKDHKGYLRVESREGKGTTFELYFPATPQEVAREQPGASIKDFMGSGETIMVIDDVEQQREIASLLLAQLGYKVKVAADVNEALAILEKQAVDLYILDMIMDPGPDGLETYQQIRKKDPAAKAIIASGYSETERVKEAQRLGAGAYIKKPYTLEQIGKAVKKELTGRR